MKYKQVYVIRYFKCDIIKYIIVNNVSILNENNSNFNWYKQYCNTIMPYILM